ncbi:MAG: CRISPR-associated endonuclease Cas1, partial [Candidatus Brocadia sp.]
SLVCDIEELFRARIDRFIIRMINLKVVSRDDFDETERGLYLKRDAVRKFVDQFEAEMEKKNQKNSLSLKEDIYIQAIVIKKWALENGSLSFYHWEIT